MKILDIHIPYTYIESKRVFDNKLPIREAAENINATCGIKISSASDYGYFFKYLSSGNGSCRGLNSYTQEYYLKNILNNCNEEQQKKIILVNFKKLIEKLEGTKIGTKKSMWAIYNKYHQATKF